MKPSQSQAISPGFISSFGNPQRHCGLCRVEGLGRPERPAGARRMPACLVVRRIPSARFESSSGELQSEISSRHLSLGDERRCKGGRQKDSFPKDHIIIAFEGMCGDAIGPSHTRRRKADIPTPDLAGTGPSKLGENRHCREASSGVEPASLEPHPACPRYGFFWCSSDHKGRRTASSGAMMSSRLSTE